MNSLFSNPELLRYARAQLRPTKLLVTGLICALLSVTLAFAALHQPYGITSAAAQLLRTVIVLQVLILALGGGIACLNAVFPEKEQNTFDYQRITRLSSAELALGKLFGAPIFMYFVCLCLMPLAIYAAFFAHADPLFVLAAYVALFVASLTFHTFCLLLSLLAIKGSQVTGILLALLLFAVVSNQSDGMYFRVHSFGPLQAYELATQHSGAYSLTDILLGHSVHHFPVLLVVDTCFILWFLLAVVRNIKRDPRSYEVFSPLQFLGFALFLNLLLVAFYNFSWTNLSLGVHSLLFFFEFIIFFLLGVALLHNREHVRTLLHSSGVQSSRLWNSLWPAPVLALGAVTASAMVVIALAFSRLDPSRSDITFAALRSLIFVLFLVSDLQLLQLLNLRPGNHPLVTAIVYLALYYFCASIILTALGCFREQARIPVASLFVPSAVFQLNASAWTTAPHIWLAGIFLQLLLIATLCHFQSRRIATLLHQPAPTPATPTPIPAAS